MWKKRCMLCVRRQDDDDAASLDYRHSSLSNVPSDVFAHERTLEELFLDSNRIRDLPRVCTCSCYTRGRALILRMNFLL
jgi:hypothetical protein